MNIVSIVPNDFIDPVAVNNLISPNNEMGKNLHNKYAYNSCIKLSIVYICLFTFLTIYIVSVCSILSINNLYYKTIKIFFDGYYVPFQTESDLTIYLIVPISVVFGVVLEVIDIFLIFCICSLSIYHNNFSKISWVFTIGFFLGIPSYVACFITILKCKKLKMKIEQRKY